MSFRERLVATLRALAPLFEEPGVMVAGSEVPNLLQPDAAATLVVSHDVDIAVPVQSHPGVKRRLARLTEFRQSPEEPSVWLPTSPGLLEANLIGLDPQTSDPGDTYVFEDPEMPMLVFGLLSFLGPPRPVQVEEMTIPLPRVAGLLLEKLATERSGEKGDRDLLVALGLLLVAEPADVDELEAGFRRLAADLRYEVLSNLAVLSLLTRRDGMPDPGPHRALLADIRRRLEASA